MNPDGLRVLARRLLTHPGFTAVAVLTLALGIGANTAIFTLQGDPVEIAYFPLVGPSDDNAWAMRAMSIAVRTAGPPKALAESVRQTVWKLDPELPMVNVRTTAEITASAMARTTFAMILLAVAASVALVLGAVGIFGVISYLVSQRTREIGVRMALGAGRPQVRGMVVGQGLRLTALGVVLGVGGALLAGRALATVLFQVSFFDPLTYGTVVLTLIAVSLAACYLPAHRAASVAPMEALRQE